MKKLVCAGMLAAISQMSFAYQAGVTASIHPNQYSESSEPEDVHGFRVSGWIEPASWHTNKVHAYLDLSYAQWRSSLRSCDTQTISIISLAPILRLYFLEQALFSPYLEGGIGPSYETRTHFTTQDLGIHYTFQDRAGIGVNLGKNKALSVAVHITHYSNGNISERNQGITVPWMLTVGYRFV